MRKRTHTVRYERDGYQPAMGYLDTAPGGAVWWNLLLGGAVGMAIDSGSGSAYVLEPDPLHVVLTPLAPPAEAPSSPR